MKLYFALSYSPFSELKKVKEWNIKNILVSYYVLSKSKTSGDRLQNFKEYDFFLDSGAFSAFTKGINIDIDEYIGYIKSTENLWTIYAGLDVIGDSEATRKNIEYMESKGIKPLPTFHYKSPLEELERMCQKYDYIALGGLVPLALNRKKMEAWLDTCFSVIKKYWPVKIHGFGVNALWAWKRYPFYSVDATSWNQGSKYGRTNYQKGFEIKQVNKKDKPVDFIKFKTGNWEVRTRQNIKVFLDLEKQITKLWETRGIKW